MRITFRSIIFFALSVLLISCGKQEWIDGDFPAEGFSASFPAPMISDPSSKSFSAWGHAGDTLLIVTRVELKPNEVPDPGREDEYFDAMAKEMAAKGKFTSPPQTASFGGNPSMEFTTQGSISDGKVGFTRLRIILVGKYVYLVRAEWMSDDKSGPASAERFHTSFHLK